MKTLPILRPGDSIEIIAPASRCSEKVLDDLKSLLTSWQLNYVYDEHTFGNDLLCANSDESRFNFLKNALHNTKTKAIICARGGYGSMRLIPRLANITPNKLPKLLIGMSDITALNLYLQQNWGWPTLHGTLSSDKCSERSFALMKSFLFGENKQIELIGSPLNPAAQKETTIESTIIGGNLSLAQASIGTLWQIDGHKKIIFLEDIGERGYRIDRMLEHLHQANLFHNAVAVLFGDFTEGKEPNGSSLIDPVLHRFAQGYNIPIIQVAGIGHSYHNIPLPLGVKTKLILGNTIKLIFDR
jgi:muramoyltetrapeptide carboxypeptidase